MLLKEPLYDRGQTKKTPTIFFALKKRNSKRNNISTLKLNNYGSTKIPKKYQNILGLFYKE